MVPEVIEMSPKRNKFMINAEMIGKASKFVNKNDFRPICTWIRVEKSELFGARITATDGMRFITFIDPQANFKGPDINLEVFGKSKSSGHYTLNSLIKACRKIKSNVQSKEGYIQFDLDNKEAKINNQRFKLDFNRNDYYDYRKVLSKVKTVTNRKTLNAINTEFFTDTRNAILNEEKRFNMSGINCLHFVNVIMEKDHTDDQGMFLLITRYAILITLPITREKKQDEASSTKAILTSKSSLLDKVHLMMGHEPKNPLHAAVLKNRLGDELEDNLGGIFSKFK